MTITIRYFASVREAVGMGSEQIELPAGAESVGAVRALLVARGGPWAESLGAQRLVRMACNQQACDESAVVKDGAEVAFFPPVTGG
jgi:molybdopterin synthase sulfur carrier subunit